jgi:hypothetical protein
MALRHPGITVPELCGNDGARYAFDREPTGVGMPEDMEADRRGVSPLMGACERCNGWFTRCVRL